jgi:hypothetical protein
MGHPLVQQELQQQADDLQAHQRRDALLIGDGDVERVVRHGGSGLVVVETAKVPQGDRSARTLSCNPICLIVPLARG